MLADGVPARDLTVSPGHAMVIAGALVHAKYLLNGRTIVQYEAVAQVSYFHIELAAREIIFAEDAPTETFMGEEFRRLFQNAATFIEAHPGEQAAETACLPTLSGFALAAARAAGGPCGDRAVLASRPRHAVCYVEQSVSICRCWALGIANPDEPVVLDVYVGDVRMARVLANEFRGDVRDAGFGGGSCGFVVALPSAWPTGALTVRRAADGALLAWTDDALAKAA